MHPRPYQRTTLPSPRDGHLVDLVNRRVRPPGPDLTWVGDITYLRTWTGWAYLATVIDCHSRKIVGWAAADHMRTELVTGALAMAISRRRPAPGVIFHSDSEYLRGVLPGVLTLTGTDTLDDRVARCPRAS